MSLCVKKVAIRKIYIFRTAQIAKFWPNSLDFLRFYRKKFGLFESKSKSYVWYLPVTKGWNEAANFQSSRVVFLRTEDFHLWRQIELRLKNCEF